MPNELTEQSIQQALASVTIPGKTDNLMAAGQVSGIVIKDGHVGFTIEIAPADKDQADTIRTAAEKAVRALDGVLSATAMMTAHQAGPLEGGRHRQDLEQAVAGLQTRLGSPDDR